MQPSYLGRREGVSCGAVHYHRLFGEASPPLTDSSDGTETPKWNQEEEAARTNTYGCSYRIGAPGLHIACENIATLEDITAGTPGPDIRGYCWSGIPERD